MQWFQAKEKSAGKKRLILTYYIYLIFGKKAVYIIAFFVSFFTFLFSSEIRNYSKKYFSVISKFVSIQPSLINQYKQIYSYACSLVDKMIMYSGGLNSDDIIFENETDKQILFNDIAKQKGICFIFSHIGNIEILQSFFQKQKVFPNLGINVFLNKKQTKIFNDFLDAIKKPMPIKYIIAEDFDAAGIIQLKDNIDKGEVIFIAGDRISQNNSSRIITTTMFNHKINLPQGTFRLAKLLECPIYFICAIKRKDGKYGIIIKKNEEKDIAENYKKYMEGIIIEYPFQFYHFYDFFRNYNE